MAAPRVKIYFENGALGQIAESPDGVGGILCTGAPVGSTFSLATPYILRGMDSLKALGVTEANNAALWRVVSQFYSEAPNGTEVWIMAFADTVTLPQMLDKTDDTKAVALINAANGRLRFLVASRTPAASYTPTMYWGLDNDVETAKAKAQALAVWAEETKAAPLFVLLEGYGFAGDPADLLDLTQDSKKYVSVFIGSTASNSRSQAVGLLAGRIAKNPIHINIGQPKDGPVSTTSAYVGALPVEKANWESLHNKGYITLRTFTGRSGYFFNDDPTATLATDDYSHLTAVRTIQKAYRVAYTTMLEKLLTAVPVNADGSMQVQIAKAWQSDVERAIASSMTANGELSADVTDPNDKGVQCIIPTGQNVIATRKVNVQIRVRPFGYPAFIDVYLGFQVVGA